MLNDSTKNKIYGNLAEQYFSKILLFSFWYYSVIISIYFTKALTSFTKDILKDI